MRTPAIERWWTHSSYKPLIISVFNSHWVSLHNNLLKKISKLSISYIYKAVFYSDFNNSNAVLSTAWFPTHTTKHVKYKKNFIFPYFNNILNLHFCWHHQYIYLFYNIKHNVTLYIYIDKYRHNLISLIEEWNILML